jgi:hypothetical protein
VAIVLKIVDPLAGLLAMVAVLCQGLDNGVDVLCVEFLVTEFGPGFGLRIGWTEDRCGDRYKYVL